MVYAGSAGVTDPTGQAMRRWARVGLVILSMGVLGQQASCLPDNPNALLTPQVRWGTVITTALLNRLGNFIERDCGDVERPVSP
ncbi:MAG TPA: hypothetical protein VMZ31_11510 [Phycisphaerae bacterium]|nr:hypothetical protein [Phycisphaerae bacterium]